MRQPTTNRVDRWWAELFGCPVSMVFQQGVTVGLHAGLGEYPGVFVAGRASGVHVSLPRWADPVMAGALADARGEDLLTAGYWSQLGPTTGMTVLGPSTHAYTDRQLDARPEVGLVTAADLGPLSEAVPVAEWEESGFALDVPVAFALQYDGQVVAAANLTLFDAAPTDVGVLVHPAYRGRGLGTVVGRAATSYAVRSQGVARWRALDSNIASRRIAARLGFEDYCRQLAVRPRPTGQS